MIKILIIIIFLIIIFFIINLYLNKNENFCYGNVYCNGNVDNSLCINQNCKNCGLQAQCTKNEDCGPNLCIKGCCDSM
jgi:hypothetical protein